MLNQTQYKTRTNPIHAHNGIEFIQNNGVLIGAISKTGLSAGAMVGTGVAIETFDGVNMNGVGITVGIAVGKSILETMAPVRSGIENPPVNVTVIV